MPDDERTRRRLGDETKGRIADLASGWTVDAPVVVPAPDPEPAPVNTPRRKQKTLPPPPPGSPERKAIEEAIVEAADTPPPARTKPPSAPPRAKTGTAPPPPPPPRKPTAAVEPSSPASAKSSGLAPRPPTETTLGPSTRSEPAFGAPAMAKGRTRSPATRQAKSGPTETGTVDVSGVIPEKTQPPERVIPPPTVDASGLGDAPKPGLIDRSGAQGTPSRVLTSKPVPPPRPQKVGSSSGSVAAIPAERAKGSASGSVAAIPGAKVGSASGPVAIPRTATPSSPAIPRTVTPPIAERLPLPPDAPPAPAMPPPVPPASSDARRGRATGPRASLVVEPILETIPDDGPLGVRLAVPVGEFDNSQTQVDEGKLRIAYEQSTIKRDAANALLGLPELPQTVVKGPPVGMLLEETAAQIQRGDATTIDPATHRFERGDPTVGDPTGNKIAQTSPKATLRASAMLRRKRGLGGDMRYVATVLFGIRRARRELAAHEATQAARQLSRRRHLTTLGRTAALAEGYDHPALNRARELLASVEDERSRHTGQVAAADTELQRVTRDRDAKAKQYVTDIAALDAELADVAKKLGPLEKQTAAVARRAADLRESIARIDAKIAATEATMKDPVADRATIQAELVALKADRKEVKRDEPELAGELDALNPRIASLEAARTEAKRKRIELEQAELEDQRRAEELLAAIGAKRKVVDRAAADAEAVRDKILFELGDRLYVDRPDSFTYELAPIDAIDVELGTGDRRMMELKEIISSVDRWKLTRGIAMIVALVAGLAALTAWILSLTR